MVRKDLWAGSGSGWHTQTSKVLIVSSLLFPGKFVHFALKDVVYKYSTIWGAKNHWSDWYVFLFSLYLQKMTSFSWPYPNNSLCSTLPNDSWLDSDCWKSSCKPIGIFSQPQPANLYMTIVAYCQYPFNHAVFISHVRPTKWAVAAALIHTGPRNNSIGSTY